MKVFRSPSPTDGELRTQALRVSDAVRRDAGVRYTDRHWRIGTTACSLIAIRRAFSFFSITSAIKPF